MKIKAIFSLIICGLVASTTAAVSLPDDPVLTEACSGGTKIFYVNGVFNSPGEAEESLELIEKAYKPLASTYGEIELREQA